MTDISERLSAAGMRIKPLVWEKLNSRYWRGPVEMYIVKTMNPKRKFYGSGYGSSFVHDTLAECKAAAQADHDARILAMIEAAK